MTDDGYSNWDHLDGLGAADEQIGDKDTGGVAWLVRVMWVATGTLIVALGLAALGLFVVFGGL